ncbi:alpha-E domain-containing protein [Brachybacterium sp. GPGPB12]|uniref:alpha-E domain-containing protein n=1 Tax=Brachybacterium sp. GPGPB12 TaxID=3023517 RepID=UPI003134533C
MVEPLLSDTTPPRSLAFQLDRLGQALDRSPETAPSPEPRAPMSAPRTRLAAWEPHELLRPPPGAPAGEDAPTAPLAEIDAATESLRTLATALEDRFFRASESTSRWGVDDV